jgi:HD-GYP domain-containing protein (c-di-GMP phosphodiesterase class II)
MPLLMRVDELRPGMSLAESFVYRGRVQLAAGTSLTEKDVEVLQKKFPKATVRIGAADLDSAIEFEDDSHEREVAQTAQGKIAETMSEVQARFTTRTSLDGVSVAMIQESIVEVIKYLQENPVSASLLNNFMASDNYLSEHAGNVFYLSMLLGASAHGYVLQERQRQSIARQLQPEVTSSLTPLGLGAMLMDIGMMPLIDLFQESRPLTAEDWKAIRDHPEAGAAMLPEDFSATAKMIVRTHHENVDGSGYPLGTPGDKLHVFTRIVRIADSFDAATAHRVYKEALSPIRVLWDMSVGSHRRFYDPELMRCFQRLIQPFPIGAKIQLNDKRFAVVVRYNRGFPLAPYVVVAFDKRNRQLPSHELEGPFLLGEKPAVRAKRFRGEDLSYLYEEPESSMIRSRVGVWPTLFEAAYP